MKRKEWDRPFINRESVADGDGISTMLRDTRLRHNSLQSLILG